MIDVDDKYLLEILCNSYMVIIYDKHVFKKSKTTF